ncbi:MAG TPA: thioesterase family protein [Flavobacteriaceae bacterium]|nr:thioesterase family protein [Flavobacteriaceae bacterium]
MKNFFSSISVRYAETDQMGVVHHGNYPQYLELARIEWLEQFGLSYKKMEDDGIMLPVYEMHFKFSRPAKFGDTLVVETILREMPRAKITFDYTIRNQENELLTKASSVLVFMDANSKRPIKCPDYILEKLKA